MVVRTLRDARAIEPLQWYAMRMVPPNNGHRRTVKLGGDRRRVRLRDGNMVERRVPGTGERVFVPEHILKKNGFAVFLPVKKVWRRRHRWTKEQELIAYPLVADWLFVGWSKAEYRWHDLLGLRVVAGVLGSGGRPVRIKSAKVAKLMQVWGDGVPPAVRRVAQQAHHGLAAGDTVRVTSGPFEDFEGRVINADSAGATVALTLFGRETALAFDHGEMHALTTSIRRPDGLLDSGAPACLRCGEPMVLAHDGEKMHHLRCGSCGAVGAVNSCSEINALEVWAKRVSGEAGS